MTPGAIARLEAGTVALNAAIERGDYRPAPVETRVILDLLARARLFELAVHTAIVHASAGARRCEPAPK